MTFPWCGTTMLWMYWLMVTMSTTALAPLNMRYVITDKSTKIMFTPLNMRYIFTDIIQAPR